MAAGLPPDSQAAMEDSAAGMATLRKPRSARASRADCTVSCTVLVGSVVGAVDRALAGVVRASMPSTQTPRVLDFTGRYLLGGSVRRRRGTSGRRRSGHITKHTFD